MSGQPEVQHQSLRINYRYHFYPFYQVLSRQVVILSSGRRVKISNVLIRDADATFHFDSHLQLTTDQEPDQNQDLVGQNFTIQSIRYRGGDLNFTLLVNTVYQLGNLTELCCASLPQNFHFLQHTLI